MRVLGISGTPRPGGNSEILLDAALEPFREAGWEINRILLSESEILPLPAMGWIRSIMPSQDDQAISETSQIDWNRHASWLVTS